MLFGRMKFRQRYREGKQLDKTEAVDMKSFERILDLEHWQNIEKKFPVRE